MKGPSRPPRRHAPACVHGADKGDGADEVTGGCETHTHTHAHVLNCWNLMEIQSFLFFFFTPREKRVEHQRQRKVNTPLLSEAMEAAGGVCELLSSRNLPDFLRSTPQRQTSQFCFNHITSSRHIAPLPEAKNRKSAAPESAPHYGGTFRRSAERRSIFNCAELF